MIFLYKNNNYKKNNRSTTIKITWSIFYKKNKKMITYDVVTNPSHAKARVLEFLPESVGSFDESDNLVMCESSDDMLVLEQDRINLLNTNILEKNFIDEILKENFERSLKSVKFKF